MRVPIDISVVVVVEKFLGLDATLLQVPIDIIEASEF